MENPQEFNKDTNIRDYRRLSIIRFSEQGLTQDSIAEGLGCSQGLVSQVLSAYESEGSSALQTATPPGAEAKLDEKALKQLKSYLLLGAKYFGYESNHWTRPRVKVLIEAKFDVSYSSLSSIGNLLSKIGFT